jgi:hypothetical protein
MCADPRAESLRRATRSRRKSGPQSGQFRAKCGDGAFEAAGLFGVGVEINLQCLDQRAEETIGVSPA